VPGVLEGPQKGGKIDVNHLLETPRKPWLTETEDGNMEAKYDLRFKR